MREFVKKVAQKASKLTPEQIEGLFESLTSENELLNAVIESSNTALLICDKSWNLLKTNKAAERYLILAEQRQNTDPVWLFVNDEEIARFLQVNHDMQKNNTVDEFTVETSGGSKRMVSVSIMPLVKDKTVAGNIVRIEDITDERNKETRLRRTESLASLTHLAANVAHEIKNPLGSISIHIQLIQKALEKARLEDGILPDKKFTEKYLEIVNQEIERLNTIIVDFLFAVRPIQAELTPTDMTKLLNQLTDFFLPELKKNNIKLQLHFTEQLPHLMLDEKLFKQSIINIVQNAIAAMPDGGVLWFSTQVSDGRCILSIADNGIGIEENVLSRIFEPYYTTKVSGTGLGLTMVYKVIKEHGGDIQVESLPESGTLFSINLPIPQREKLLLS